MNRALAFLGVEPAEERSVALMTAHAFFMGASTVFFETAVVAFFLARFDTRYLPWVYIVAAVANTITGAAYTAIQRRVRFARLMRGTLWFLLIGVTSMRVGFGVSTAAWLAFGGLVFYRVLSILTDLEYWAVAARVYDVRQAKRLFGLIGTGEVVARIVGAFSVPLIVRFAGVANLIVLSALSLGVCLIVLRMVLALAHGPPSVIETSHGKKPRAALRRILESRYLTLVVGVAIFATFGKYFVDFAFLQQMATRSKDETELASLLGIINGATQVLSLLTRLFVSRPLLRRFGVRLGLLVLPALHLLCTLGILATSMIGDASIVFWFAVANQGIYDTFKHPIDNPSFKVLYQPLRRDQRLTTQIAVEAVINPLVIGIAGCVMLVFSAAKHYSPALFAPVLLATFALWLILGRLAGSAYVRALIGMLRRSAEGSEQLDLTEATTRSVLRASLAHDDPSEVCASLQLLERSGAPEIIPTLVEHSAHAAPEVRRYVIERLTDLEPSALWPIRHRLSTDPVASVRGSALRLIGSVQDTVTELLPHLDDPDPIVRRAVVAHLFELHDEDAKSASRERIASWAKSQQATDRTLAARLAGEHGLAEVARALLDDSDPDVCRAALTAMGRLHVPAVLFDRLEDRRFAETAVKALAANGATILDEVDRRFVPDEPRLIIARLARVCALVGGPRAVAILRARLDFPDVAVRGAVLNALDRLRDAPPAEMVHALLREEIAAAVWALASIRDLGSEPELDDLRRALAADVRWAGRRVLRLLPMLYDRTAILRARENLEHVSKEKRAYALELLDLTLELEDRELVIPLLDASDPADRLAHLEECFPQETKTADERITLLVSRPERWQRAFTRALAIRAAIDRGILDPTTEHGEPMMLLIEKILLLKTVPMFVETPEEVLAEIAGVMQEVDCKAGQVIFEKGDAGDSMYIVIDGRVRVFDGERTLSHLGEREIFGELALLDPKSRSASVEATEDSRLFRLDDDTFSQLMAGNLEMVRGVLHVLCERLRRTSAQT